MSQIVAIPETAIKDPAQTLVPNRYLFLIEGTFAISLDRLFITFGHETHILRPAGTPLQLEHTYAGIHHLIHEMNRLQVLRRHDILILHIQLDLAILIMHRIGTTTNLHASPPVGGSVHLMQTQIAFTGHGHAQSPVSEHLYADQFPFRALDLLLHDLLINLMHLL